MKTHHAHLNKKMQPNREVTVSIPSALVLHAVNVRGCNHHGATSALSSLDLESTDDNLVNLPYASADVYLT